MYDYVMNTILRKVELVLHNMKRFLKKCIFDFHMNAKYIFVNICGLYGILKLF